MTERDLFIAALQQDDASQRRDYLREVCGKNLALLERVEGLLRVYEDADSFLESPPSPPPFTVESPSLSEGEGIVIGPYKLMEQLGEGGMGVVFVAEQTQPVRRQVALKIIKPGMDTKQVIARFEAERQALAMMDHPNIARVIDGGATDTGRTYFVMELVRGIPITEYCDREQLSIPERLELFVLVCRAVQHAHQKGIIHRDIKPSNILVTVIDGAATPKVIDFGVAKATGASLTDRTVYTAFHQFVGTPLYMSPEQADLSGMDVDTRSDIYSLGVLLYELLTGTTPFDRETFRTVAFDEMRRILREQEPPTPSTRLSALGERRTTVSANRKADARQLDRTVRGDLDWVVMKALEKDRRRRYETANDFAADVMRYLTDRPVEARPPSALYRFGKFVRRNKGPVAAGLTLATLLVLGTLGTSIGLVRALRAERDATREKERATAAEVAAKDAAAAAEAVSNFLQKDLLAQADPDQNARGKKITVEELLGRAAARIEGKFARQPLVEAKIRQTIGNAYRALSNYAAAGPHLERARELTAARGDEDLDALSVLSDLAGLYMSQNRTSEAKPLMEKVFKMRSRVLGKESVDTLESMLDLALIYGEEGQVSKAESIVKDVREISHRARGEENQQTLHAMNNLATLYANQGRFDDAIPLLEKVLEVQLRIDGEEHINTLAVMGNLADLYAIKHNPRATGMLARTLEISRRVLGVNHEETLLRASSLARAYWYAKDLDRAIAVYEEVVPKLKTHLDTYHYGTTQAMADLGWAYIDKGRLHDAIAMLEQAWELDRKRPGTLADPSSSTPMLLAGAYEQTGQFHRAESLRRDAVEAARKDRNKPIAYVHFLVNRLGGTLIKQKKYIEAESLLLTNYEEITRLEGKVLPRILKSRLTKNGELLVQLYDTWCQPEKASEWKARLGISDLPADVFALPRADPRGLEID